MGQPVCCWLRGGGLGGWGAADDDLAPPHCPRSHSFAMHWSSLGPSAAAHTRGQRRGRLDVPPPHHTVATLGTNVKGADVASEAVSECVD